MISFDWLALLAATRKLDAIYRENSLQIAEKIRVLVLDRNQPKVVKTHICMTFFENFHRKNTAEPEILTSTL